MNTEGVDWNEFVRIAEFHRVLDSVVPQLKSVECGDVPAWVVERLAGELQLQRLSRLRHLALLCRICDVFEEKGIPFVVLKGPVVAQWIWGDPCGRHFKDLDILVAKDEIPRALSALLELGLTHCSEVERIERFHWERNTSIGQHFTLRGSWAECVELHWRISFGNSYRGLESFAGQLREWSVCGRSVSSFKEIIMLEYLLDHGCRHFWFRLKWLMDFSKLVETETTLFSEMASLKSCKNCRNLLAELGLCGSDIDLFSRKGVFFRSIAQRLLFSSKVGRDLKTRVYIRIYDLLNRGVSAEGLRRSFWDVVPGRLVVNGPLPKCFWFLYIVLSPVAALFFYYKDVKKGS
ncbi:nucleotidyltransferase domain-containing protein [Pelagicoccus mobilis]|uniref:Nucleotidyltransferase family protein n=1 Tax=Pelagicoccus mobilis TaxID=415221 RepID=A0A934RQI0_9BACT|nr:nucleotidyltransferase family protein [Pelagicoccus mobilis]MBK1875665.1 nucleotidyltransferase family protein [Pelagicoccus mobilis]